MHYGMQKPHSPLDNLMKLVNAINQEQSQGCVMTIRPTHINFSLEKKKEFFLCNFGMYVKSSFSFAIFILIEETEMEQREKKRMPGNIQCHHIKNMSAMNTE